MLRHLGPVSYTHLFMDAGPILLEPIASLKVTVPDQYTGDAVSYTHLFMWDGPGNLKS